MQINLPDLEVRIYSKRVGEMKLATVKLKMFICSRLFFKRIKVIFFGQNWLV